MKKFFAIAAVILAVSFSAQAQSKHQGTRMSQCPVNIGVAAGYGTGDLGGFAHVVADFNVMNTNVRFRTTLGLMERWVSPAASVNVQYLLPLFGGLYLYPSVGAYAELHDMKNCHDVDKKEFSYGGVFGGGLEYQFSEHFGFFVEGGYQVLTPAASRPAVSVGAMIHF